MKSNFDAEFFKRNRDNLRKLFTGTAPIVLTAHGLLQRSADSTYPFRQDSSFWYLTGINEPDIILVIDKEKEYLIVPDRDASRQAFDGSIDFDDLKNKSGIEDVLDEKTGWKQLSGRLGRVGHVATLAASPSYIEAHGMYVNPARRRLIKRLTAEKEGIELLDLRQHLTRLRMIKQEPELAVIRQAIDLTAKGFKKLKRGLKDIEFEHEAEAVFTALFRQNGYNHSYEPIVAYGTNACTLHYMANNSRVGKDGLLLLDVGADVEGYAADISRTYSLSGEPTKRETQVWQATLEVQEYAISLLKPGVVVADYEKQVEAYMGEKLRELGLIKIIDHDNVRQFYPHATSHFLGLDVHDVADYERPLEPGMVLTVEPGIYIPEEAIGIRIEDDVLITDDGIEVLSAKLPREL